jgi:hypothetical protein
MFKHKFGLVVLLALLVAVLSACGDSTATTAPATTAVTSTTAAAVPASTTAATNPGSDSGLPSISGATTVALPDMLKQQASAYTSNVKNGSFAAYKVGDQPSKVEGTVSDSFKKAGWEDKSAMYASAAAPLKSQGIFLLTFQKGTQVATVVGYPGSVAAPLGAGVGVNDTFYMVISGSSL